VTIIVSVKFNDGIVVASDSTTAFFRESEFVQSYDNANKIFNLYKGLPIGAATCGTGGIGNASVSTLSKDLRARFQGSARGCTDWKLDPENYTMGDIARRAREFLLMAVEASEQVVSLTYWVFGYSSGRPLPELWGIYINGKDIPEPTLIAAEGASLPNWAGETEALDRLIIGRSASLVDSAVKNGMEADKATDLVIKAGSDLYERSCWPRCRYRTRSILLSILSRRRPASCGSRSSGGKPSAGRSRSRRSRNTRASSGSGASIFTMPH
jgi:hypothetical protein